MLDSTEISVLIMAGIMLIPGAVAIIWTNAYFRKHKE